MSYRAMMKQRCDVLRLTVTQLNGYESQVWVTVKTGERCFLDLGFIRQGKDPQWTPEAGRAADRSGVLFTLPTTTIRPGDRIKMTKGPVGTFAVEGAIDEAWRPTDKHHVELGVTEVAKAITGKVPDA